MSLSFNNVNLDEVVDFVRGLTYSKKDEVEFSNNVVLRANNINVENNELDFTELKYINGNINVPTKKIVQPNTLLICTASGSKKHLGKIALIDNNYGYAFGGFMGLLVPKNNILPKFLYYRLSSETYKSFIDSLSSGVNINNLRFDLIRNFKIPLPPIPEQKRIVKILDKAFAAINKAKANAQKNLQNSRELFESWLNKVFSNPCVDWEEKKLGEIAAFRNGMNFTKASKGETIKIVGVRDFQNSFWVPFENLESVTIDGVLKEIDFLRENDILAVRSNGNPELIGRTLLTRNIADKASHSGFTIRVRLNSDIISPEYLCHYLKTKRTRKYLVETGTGVNIKSLNQSALSSLRISFPKSLTNQQTIVKNVKALSAESEKLETIYQQKLVDLEELKKSILQKAFDGQL